MKTLDITPVGRNTLFTIEKQYEYVRDAPYFLMKLGLTSICALTL